MSWVCPALLSWRIPYSYMQRLLVFRVPEYQSGSNAWKEQINAIFEWEKSKSCFIIVICCIICNLPVILTVSKIINIDSVSTNAILSRWLIALAMLNTSLNSIILFWRNKRLRIHAKIYGSVVRQAMRHI